MSLHGLALFSLVYLLAWATPGPATAAFVARVLARGTRGLPAIAMGFIAGDLVWLTLAATGMAVLAQTAHTVFTVVKYLGALYLLVLAYRMWIAPARALTDETEIPGDENSPRLFAGALALTVGNPKAMVFFLALLPTVVDLQEMTLGAFVEIAVAMCVVLSGLLAAYAAAALRARRFFRNARAVQWLNRGTGTAMAGAAVAVATR